MKTKIRRKLNVYSLSFNIWFFVSICLLVVILFTLSAYLLITGFFYNDIMGTRFKQITNEFAQNCAADYNTAIEKTDLTPEINAALFDRAGQMLAETSDFYKLFQNFTDIRSTIMKNDDIYFNSVAGNQYVTLIAGQKVDLGEGNVGFVFLTTEIYSKSMQMQVITGLVITILIVIFIIAEGLAVLVASRITAPINKIYKNLKQLTKGDYSVKFESTGYTEIDKLASSLTMAAQQLKETDDLKTELIANVSHDLKTPLTLIKSYAEMIRDLSGDNKEKRNEHLEVIISETTRLTTLVNDLVKLSKLQSQKQEMVFTEFNLSKTAENALKNFEVLKDYDIRKDIEPDVIVVADEEKIFQVLSNLIGNAVNYTGDDKYVKLSLHRIEGNRVRVDVYDHGAGIPEDETEKIWDRYYRSKKNHKREVAGTGLGLSIVKSILLAHNSEYGVNSVLGKGSDFYFILDE